MSVILNADKIFSETGENEGIIRRWLAENRSDRHGKFTYSLVGYGIIEGQLREIFSEYIDRFQLT